MLAGKARVLTTIPDETVLALGAILGLLALLFPGAKCRGSCSHLGSLLPRSLEKNESSFSDFEAGNGFSLPFPTDVTPGNLFFPKDIVFIIVLQGTLMEIHTHYLFL